MIGKIFKVITEKNNDKTLCKELKNYVIDISFACKIFTEMKLYK